MARDPKTGSELPGRLIVVEGVDGSGKSTQIYLLKRWLEMEQYKVLLFRVELGSHSPAGS